MNSDCKDLEVEDLEGLENLDISRTAEDENHILGLPDELLLHIFSHLPLYDIHQRIALVCRHFLRLSRDPSLTLTISLKSDTAGTTDDLTTLIFDSVCLTSLKIRGRDDAEILTSMAITACPKLTSLEINYCGQVSSDCLVQLVDSPLCHTLKSLNLEGTIVSSHFISQLHRLKNLRSLNLFNCRHFLSKHLENVAENCTLLEELNIEEVTHLSDACVVKLLHERKDSLKVLYLDGESLTDQSFRHLSICKKLQELGICFAEEISDDGMEAISSLRWLTTLKLRRAKTLQAIDYTTTFSANHLARLKCLDLSESAMLNDQSIIEIATNCPKLQTLILNWCWEIRDVGMEHVVLYCNDLEYLSLVGVVLLTDKFLHNICRLLPNLHRLDLQQCPNLTDSYLEKIVQEASETNLVIVNYYGEPIQGSSSGNDETSTTSDDQKSSSTEGAVASDDLIDLSE